MRTAFVAILGAVLAACSPGAQQQSAPAPEAVVRTVFDAAVQRNAHGQATTVDDLPLSDSFKALINQATTAAEANDEPFIDGDLVLDCQDCSPISAVTVAATSPPLNGRATIEARFTVAGDARVETWDMVETPQGWRADNIRSNSGYNLRQSAEQEIRDAAKSCTETRGAQEAARLVSQCTQVSPATHPPCNAANSCGMIEAETRRGCGLLDAAHRPAFCTDEGSGEAP
ncbi:MAG: hypothetical protein HY054_11540 [Proteobacteria bacterium]|nr:hypothetical protein [Pseudomonadota bacterium]